MCEKSVVHILIIIQYSNRYEYIMTVIDIGGIAQDITEVEKEINKIEQKITDIKETLKELYFKASLAMTENQNYLLVSKQVQ